MIRMLSIICQGAQGNGKIAFMQYFVKILVTTLLVIFISEAAKRNQAVGAILASLPVTSILAISWFYYETGNKAQTASLTTDIFLMVVPSLAFFIALPMLLRRDYSYTVAIGCSSGITAVFYFIFIKLANLVR
ncbi:MAG TPA: DUF3147 family protein [Candidatus Ozemobacteraceae bacterium]|nr:DUF3147 family protein [Candidatus Ozemobacteraceae bacterium]